MVSVQGLTVDLDEIFDEIETNGLSLASFGNFRPVDDSSNDAARIDDGGNSDNDKLMMVIVVTLGVVVLCMFFGVLFYCRQSKKVLVTEIRHVNAAGDTIYTSRKRSMPEQQTRGRGDSEGFYRDPITATEPIHQQKRNPNPTIQYPPMTMTGQVSSSVATRSIPAGMTADATVGGAAITDTSFEGDAITGGGTLGFWPGEINQDQIDEEIEGNVTTKWV